MSGIKDRGHYSKHYRFFISFVRVQTIDTYHIQFVYIFSVIDKAYNIFRYTGRKITKIYQVTPISEESYNDHLFHCLTDISEKYSSAF